MNRILTSGFALLGALVVVACGPSPGQQAGNGGRPGMHHGMDRMGGMGRMMQPQVPAPANAPASLSRFGCLSCHDIHSAGVGPAYAWVAWRYHDQAHAAQSLSVFIEHGGRGPWTGVMPDLNVPPADADDIAHWILSLPPEAPPEASRGHR